MSIILIQTVKIEDKWFEHRVTFKDFESLNDYLKNNSGQYFKVVCYVNS